MALSKIDADSVDLTDNFAFTGTVTGAGLTSPFGNTVAVTSEGGAATTSLVKGLAKWWVNADNSVTHEVQGSFNNSSILDETSSKTSFSYTANMSDALYSVPTGGHFSDTNRVSMYFSCFNNLTTGGVKCNTGTYTTGNTATEIDLIFATVLGDLA